MKHLVVFSLIVVMATQWVGSLFTISMVDAIVVKTTMTAKESVMAAYLTEKFELSSNIHISEVEPNNYVRMGYAAPFVFSDDSDGEISYYSINHNNTKILNEITELSLSDLQNNTNPHVIYCFFPIFINTNSPIELQINYSNHQVFQMGYSNFYQSLYPSIPLLPPNYLV